MAGLGFDKRLISLLPPVLPPFPVVAKLTAICPSLEKSLEVYHLAVVCLENSRSNFGKVFDYCPSYHGTECPAILSEVQPEHEVMEESYLPEGAAVAPIIIATDKTQLTQFLGNKAAYPVYLTLGNIPRAIRHKPSEHACILLGYLPVSKIGKKNLTKRECKARGQKIFHAAMRIILKPLI
ncbi:uncharacterized protein B0H18DRAFT_1125241 [Fomitopsis serialis]|uniref:uncharacterized protein n=1 Tax=Fomitopsis serialis TaxID=139415 RepID=UPI0020083B68|nr:uncharacterized protein B0H18DRAFT_1125241 [Neoantrodia serialis]KAH9914854.1 hypothetical protein B0H18DRAFT_1125241 [Neoantrodia serialis]